MCCLSGMGDVSQPGVVSPSEQSSCWCVRRGTELLSRNTVAVRCAPAAGAGAPHETARILTSGHSSQCRSSLRRGAGPIACYIQDTSLCVGGMKQRKETSSDMHRHKGTWTSKQQVVLFVLQQKQRSTSSSWVDTLTSRW